MDFVRQGAGVTGAARRPPRLLEQVRQRLRVKHYSLRTEQAYWAGFAVSSLPTASVIRARWAGRGRALSDGLATRGKVAAGTQNQALAALLFLYREVLAVELPWMDDMVRAKRPRACRSC